MCGITGVIQFQNSRIPGDLVVKAWEAMFKGSLRRGSDSSGVLAITPSTIYFCKQNTSANKLLKGNGYYQLKKSLDLTTSLAFLGHSRLATNGRATRAQNNQPVVLNRIALIHNGIVVNERQLKIDHDLRCESELDSEVIIRLLERFEVESNPAIALQKLFSSIQGNSTIALTLAKRGTCLIATNNGGVYFYQDLKLSVCLFASEPIFIRQGLRKLKIAFEPKNLTQIEANQFVEIPTNKLAEDLILINNIRKMPPEASSSYVNIQSTPPDFRDFSTLDFPDFRSIKRCFSCILPITFPGITFDASGVCHYCRGKGKPPKELLGVEKLLNDLGIYSETYSGEPILVGVSGGRDSCYGLHFLVRVLGLKVIAFTYDWGMVTDLARRNIARVCGELGIEHIIVAPNISRKLRNIRLNISAWMKKPDLGLIPLMMAGDKQFFYYANSIRKERLSPSVVLCAGNTFETTLFKTAFAGISQKENRGVLRDTTRFDSLKLLRYYMLGFLKNPRYINVSVWDSFKAFWSSYFLKDDYIYLFNYIEWDETSIMEILTTQYAWESASDTSASWRIGDGTSAFYNYVYYSVAGFTESDTFRSNQIRAGVLNRTSAMDLVERENIPRISAIEEYSAKIGVTSESLFYSIHSMKKLWD